MTHLHALGGVSQAASSTRKPHLLALGGESRAMASTRKPHLLALGGGSRAMASTRKPHLLALGGESRAMASTRKCYLLALGGESRAIHCRNLPTKTGGSSILVEPCHRKFPTIIGNTIILVELHREIDPRGGKSQRWEITSEVELRLHNGICT